MIAGRVARQRDHDHAAIAEHVLIARDQLLGRAAAQPRLQGRGFSKEGRRLPEGLEVDLVHNQPRARKHNGLAGVVGMVVADAEHRHVGGLETEPRELISDRNRQPHMDRVESSSGLPSNATGNPASHSMKSLPWWIR